MITPPRNYKHLVCDTHKGEGLEFKQLYKVIKGLGNDTRIVANVSRKQFWGLGRWCWGSEPWLLFQTMLDSSARTWWLTPVCNSSSVGFNSFLHDDQASKRHTEVQAETIPHKHIVWGMGGTLLLGARNSELQSYAYYVQDPQVSPQHHMHACTHTSRLYPVIPVGEVDCAQTFLCC